MVAYCGMDSLDDLVDSTVPSHLRCVDEYAAPPALGERALLAELARIGEMNEVYRSFLGQGFYDTQIPPVIKRGILENPGWYTQYTPYQAEIAQGRLESLFNFQTMICELTGLAVANASLLDEPTAAAEAMGMCFAHKRGKKKAFLVDANVHRHSLSLLRSRAEPLGIEVRVSSLDDMNLAAGDVCGLLVQYPGTDGAIPDVSGVIAAAKENKILSVAATDPMAMVVLEAPGTLGFDMAVGTTQRFGVPLGYGGPHAAFIATTADHVRKLPGRIVGKTIDAQGGPAFRLALQTREQHIRRGKAVSNICTAQALLANIAAMYAVYHGPQGLTDIATRIHRLTAALGDSVKAAGHTLVSDQYFDTITVTLNGTTADALVAEAAAERINIRKVDDVTVAVSFDETVTEGELTTMVNLFWGKAPTAIEWSAEAPESKLGGHARTTEFLTQEVFNKYESETEMMRYLKHLENKDVSLVHSPIPLGSCTMKLNAAVEMQALSMPNFANIHPFVPDDQAKGYHMMFEETKDIFCKITGYDDMTLQPNSGAQGELAGLVAIQRYHRSRGDENRTVCLIPMSAHGTNPASAVMAGMKVVDVKMTSGGVVNLDDFKSKLEKHRDQLSAMMITYPSTFGVFDENVSELCDMIHDAGGQVYLDGANLNAEVNLVRPGHIGADVSHLNLHKTFCIPHGGGGPGMGPIGVRSQLAPFLPSHPLTADPAEGGYAISGTPYGSSLITTISWAYCRMMGTDGLTEASKIAILNANYMMERLKSHYNVRFVGKNGQCAHEFILDCGDFKKTAGIEASDIAKRLQDFGLHAPTVSWPMPNALMIEPTESESKDWMDRYCDALITIREEIAEVEEGKYDRDNNVVVNSPHPLSVALKDEWDLPYPRSQAAYPADWLKESKMWPTVGRVDDVYGDKNLITSIPPRARSRPIDSGRLPAE
jgi:glycine dehydrogenase